MRRHDLFGIVSALALAAGGPSALADLGTAITYQGQLKNLGVEVNSNSDFEFSLWTAAMGGSPVGGTHTALNVPVADGLFTVDNVQFGVNPYTTDQALWLQINVRNPAGVNAFQPMGSRQKMTAAPFSLATRGINVDGNSNVGIGTSSPGEKLDVGGRAHFTGSGSTPVQNSAFWIDEDIRIISTDAQLSLYSNNTGAGSGAIVLKEVDATGLLTNQWTLSRLTNADFDIAFGLGVQPGGTSVMRFRSDGNVGIGTATPGERLDVAGNIKIRTNDRLYFGAPGENTDPIFLRRYIAGADSSVLELVLGDNPGGGSVNDAFIISTRATDDSNQQFRFQFNSDGNALKPGGGAWAALCDERSKNDVQPLTGTLDRLLKLKGHSYTYKPEYVENGRALPGTQIGLVAQEVEAVFPDWVTTGPEGLKMVTERSTTALMVEAMRDLRNEKDAEIGTLKARLEHIEALFAAQAANAAK